MSIKLYALLGPKLETKDPIEADELVERLVKGTGLTRGIILAVLAELDDIIIQGLRRGQRVKLPNGLIFAPFGKANGQIKIVVKLAKEMISLVNSQFKGKWINAQNIGKSEEELLAQYNEMYPDQPLAE